MRLRIAIGIPLALFLMVFVMSGPVLAESLKDRLTKQYGQEKDICTVVKETIREGLSAKDITSTCIGMGHDACLIVRCAVEAKGNLAQIITGALEAGTSSDVCSRCAMNAGADAKEIARILEPGLGYSAVAGGGLTPVEIGLPGGNRNGGIMSSSRFR